MHRMLLNFAAVLVLGPLVVVAEPITIGSLSSNDDGTTEVISDSLNGLEWLRWDEIPDFNYDSTVEYADENGWSIAGISEAQQFVNALIPDPTCTVGEIGSSPDDCGTAPSFLNLAGDNFQSGSAQAWFLSDNGTGDEVGSLLFSEGENVFSAQTENRCIDLSCPPDLSPGSDFWSSGQGGGDNPITWLLYRETTTSEPDEPTASVPEPGTLGLLGAGLIGMGFARRRKKAQ